MAKPDDDQPDVPNVSVDTVRPPAPSAGDLYSSATVLRQVPQELIEAARARRHGRAAGVPAAPPPPAVPTFDPFPTPTDDAPSLEVGYADDDEAPAYADEAPPTPRAFASFGGNAPHAAPSSSRPTTPGPDGFRIPPAGPSSRPTPVGVQPASDLLAQARPSAGGSSAPPTPQSLAASSAPPTPRVASVAPAVEHTPPRDIAQAPHAPRAPVADTLAELDEDRPAFVTVRPEARRALSVVGLVVMALVLAAALLLALRAFD